MPDETVIVRYVLDSAAARKGAEEIIASWQGVDRAQAATDVGLAIVAKHQRDVALGAGAVAAGYDAMTSATQRYTHGLAATSAAVTSLAANQAAAFARMADQRAAQASLAQTRTLMEGVAKSAESLAHVYGSVTAAATTSGAAQSQAAGFAKLAEQNMIAAARAKSQATMAAVSSISPDQLAAMYGVHAAAPAMVAPGRTPLSAHQRANLGFQLNDVFTSLVGGMNPLMVAAQQGPQVTQIFGGLRQTLAAIPRGLMIGGGAALGAGAAAWGWSELRDLTEALEAQKRRLGDMLGDQRLAAQAYADIRKEASAAGRSVEEVTVQYERFIRAGAAVGATGRQAIGLTSMVGQLGRLGGATAEEQTAASGALARALKESVVSASSLDAILEGLPGLGQRIADGIGVSVVQLRLMAAQGDLTNKQVFDGLLSQQDKVAEKFKEANITVGGFFSRVAQGAEDLAVGLYKTVTAIEMVSSKAEAARKAAEAADLRAANAGGRVSRATPRVIGNSGQIRSLEEMGFGQASQAGATNDFAALEARLLDVKRAAQGAAAEVLLAASAIADKLIPELGAMKSLQQQADALNKGLAALNDDFLDLPAEKKAQEVDKLTEALRRNQLAMEAVGSATTQTMRALSIRGEQFDRGLTDAQRDLENREADLLAKGARPREAEIIANGTQIQNALDSIRTLEQQVELEEKKTKAMMGGKQAMMDYQVAALMTAWVNKNVAASTEEAAEAMDVFIAKVGGLYTKLVKEQTTQAGIGAGSGIAAELKAIEAAQKVVTEGAYAMARAQEAAKNPAGLKLFDARQGLTDAVTIQNLTQEVTLTKALAAAAGDVAKQRAIQLDYDIKRAQLAAAPGARAAIDEQMRAKAAADLTRDLAEGAVAMERQVELTLQQAGLVKSGSAEYAIQLAILNKKNELLARGVDIESKDAQRQIAAAGAQARADQLLKREQDAAELTKRIWQNAYDNIQSYGADAFYDVFSGATVTGASAAEAMKRIFLRTFAEIAAAAIIRPLIQPIFAAGQSLGIVPNGVGGTSGLGSLGWGGSSGGMPPLSGGGGWLGGVGDWLNTPFTGPYAGMSPSSMAGVPMLSPSMWNPSSWSITPLQGLGALAGAGMGVYQLANSKSTAGTIGGISSIVGAGLSLIPGIGPFLGPAVGLLGNLLPGLFGMGEQQPTIANQTYGQLTYGSGGWYTTGGAWGPSANSSDSERGLKSLGGNISNVFNLLGGVKDPSKVWGLSAQNRTLSGPGWSDSSDSLYLVDPNGGQQLWRMNEQGMMDTGSAQVAYRSILEGAVGEITANMRKAVTQTGQTMGGTSLQAIAETVAEVLAFDEAVANLGKTMLTAEAAIKQIDDGFAAMYATADKYGLATGDVDAAKAQARLGYATDFGKGLSREILQMTDPKAAALADLDDWKSGAVENNKWLLDNVTGAMDQILEIEKLYALRRKEIVEDGAKASLTGLQDVIKRLTYGDLSGAAPAATLSGLQGTYSAMLAKANLGDQVAVAGLGQAAAEYAQFAGSYYGTSTPQYQSLVGSLRGNLAGVYTAQGGTDPLIVALTTVSAQFAASEQDNAALKAEMAELTAAVAIVTEKMQRLLDKMAA